MKPKYRAWIKNKKCMEEVAMLHWSEDLPLSTELVLMRVVIRSANASEWIYEHYKPYEVELMQYAGLQDASGKDIYEGDILQFEKQGYLYNDARISIAVVEFEYGGFSPFCIPLGSNDCAESCGSICDPKQCKIIGNIYETPDLIK